MDTPLIGVKIFGKTFVGLIDSGCKKTIIGRSVFEWLKQRGITITPYCGEATVANGISSKIEGKVRLNLKALISNSSRRAHMPCYVMTSLNSNFDLLLGTDFQ